MSRCRTCKHWFVPTDGYRYRRPPGSGECQAAMPVWEAVRHDDSEDADYGDVVLRSEHAGVLSFVEDGSQYRATLITMPDFGCVRYEVKP